LLNKNSADLSGFIKSYQEQQLGINIKKFVETFQEAQKLLGSEMVRLINYDQVSIV
jgi:hypothetical protein